MSSKVAATGVARSVTSVTADTTSTVVKKEKNISFAFIRARPRLQTIGVLTQLFEEIRKCIRQDRGFSRNLHDRLGINYLTICICQCTIRLILFALLNFPLYF